MHHVFSKIDGRLLHLVNRFDEIKERTNVAPDEQFLQLATLKMKKGKIFKPHKHIWKPTSRQQVIAQESWVVIQGSVLVYFYDIDGTFIETTELSPGDCSMTFEGGHTYEILENNTVVYEYKTGPYEGVENDKEFI